MKTTNFEMPIGFGDECSSIEFMTAADYEICETVEKFIKSSSSVLGDECCSIMEAAHRGLSHKMQLVLTHRLMNYLVYGSYSSTGVPHVDELLEKIIKNIPDDTCDCLKTIWPKFLAKKDIRNRKEDLANNERDQPSIVFYDNTVTMYKRTKASDFPLEVNAKGFTKTSKKLLDKDSYELLVDSLRGLSDQMQYTMCMRIMDYLLFGVLLPTGVKHVDSMIKELITKYPYDRQQFDLFVRKAN